MALSDRDVQAVAAALMPLIGAMVQASVTEAVRRAVVPQLIPGTITSVSGADVRVEPDDAPGTFVEATQTDPGQVAAVRTVVLVFGNGAGFCFGVIP